MTLEIFGKIWVSNRVRDAEDESGLRYRLLETVREYGLKELGSAGDPANTTAHPRHAGLDVSKRLATGRTMRPSPSFLCEYFHLLR